MHIGPFLWIRAFPPMWQDTPCICLLPLPIHCLPSCYPIFFSYSPCRKAKGVTFLLHCCCWMQWWSWGNGEWDGAGHTYARWQRPQKSYPVIMETQISAHPNLVFCLFVLLPFLSSDLWQFFWLRDWQCTTDLFVFLPLHPFLHYMYICVILFL